MWAGRPAGAVPVRHAKASPTIGCFTHLKEANPASLPASPTATSLT